MRGGQRKLSSKAPGSAQRNAAPCAHPRWAAAEGGGRQQAPARAATRTACTAGQERRSARQPLVRPGPWAHDAGGYTAPFCSIQAALGPARSGAVIWHDPRALCSAAAGSSSWAPCQRSLAPFGPALITSILKEALHALEYLAR